MLSKLHTWKVIEQEVRNLVRVNSYRYFPSSPRLKSLPCWWHRGRWKDGASHSPRFGAGHSCSTDSQAAGLLLHSPVLAEPGGAGSERWTASWDCQADKKIQEKGKKYRPKDYHEGYEDVLLRLQSIFRSKRLPSTLLLFLLACWGSQ